MILKIKKCAYRSKRTKTQTPIVAKLTSTQYGVTTIELYGICILSNSIILLWQKIDIIILKKENYTAICVYLVSLAYLE